MKKLTSLVLTTAACLVLSACSGGGGKSGSSNTTQAVNTPAVTTPVASQSATVTGSAAADNATATGGVYVLSGDDRNFSLSKKALTAASLTSLVVDGVSMPIAYPNIYAATWTNINGNYSCCGKYADVRFGIIENEDKDHFFYNGNPTKAMPTTGTASYNGHFIVSADDDLYRAFDNNDVLLGTAKFTADFTNKKLSGTLSQELLHPISVNATISGNSFVGNAQSVSFTGTADVDGRFYGTNAKELGGVFMDNRLTWGGAFGAAQ